MWLHETRLSTSQSLILGVSPSPRLPQTQIALLTTVASVRIEPNALALVVVLKGGCLIDGPEGRIQLGARRFLVCDPGERVVVQMQPSGLALVLSFSAAALRRLDAINSRCPLPGQGRLSTAAVRCICAALREAQAPTAAFWLREPSVRALLRHIAHAQTDLQAKLSACPGKSYLRKTQVMLRLQRARRFLEANCDRNVRIAELAEMTNFSHWYFTKTFHRVFGESPKHFATRMRMERARQLLHRADSAIGEVAAACGFENHSAFSRAYRQRFGTTAARSRQLSPPPVAKWLMPAQAPTKNSTTLAMAPAWASSLERADHPQAVRAT
jgi:AraC family transcriptional regulator